MLTGLRGRSETTFAQKGGGGGQLVAILCKLFRPEVYIKRGGGGQKSRKYSNVVYVRPPTSNHNKMIFGYDIIRMWASSTE